jgi:hypothetical protein
MPLESGKSKAAFSHNVKAEVAAGKPQKQAVAIAYSKARDAEIECDGYTPGKPYEAAGKMYASFTEAIRAAEAGGGEVFEIRENGERLQRWAPIPKKSKPAVRHELVNAAGEVIPWTKTNRRHGRDADIECDADVDVEPAALDSARTLAFDRRMETVDGHLVVTDCNISKANVCPYLGSEIPGAAELGLDPSRVYMLYRDAAELEAAVKSYERVPLMMQHVAVSADNPQQFLIVGTVSNVRFRYPFLKADLTIWTREGIEAVETGTQKEVSAGYRYTPDMTPGTSPDGTKYDGRMTQLVANHVALVEAGRCGPDVCVGDSAARAVGLASRLNPT